MADELWNRVNIPFPSAVSSVRIHFTGKTDANVKALLVENEKVLNLIHSELLQTEIRVLYELLYILSNSYRGNKTLRSLKQVEQCINRLKNMKLAVALQELTDLCPSAIQRGISIKTGECDVPSQPMMEWLCLKLLGAAQLMTCTLNRCKRAFTLTKQHMNIGEFVILNMVITNMLSRLWVIFRAVLVSLSILYQQLLELLREVAHAQPMPFLTAFPLPADMTNFLHLSDAFILNKQSKQGSPAIDFKEQKQHRKSVSSATWKMREDLGVSIQRDVVFDADIKSLFKLSRDLPQDKAFLRETDKKKQQFKKQLRDATTFTDMSTRLGEMILWCKSERMEKEKRLLKFLRLKCQKMKSLEAAGYNVQRKLLTFRQEACWASSPQGSVPRTYRFLAAIRRNTYLRTSLHSLRSRFKSSLVKSGVKKQLKRRWKTSNLSVFELSGDCQRTTHEPSPQTIDCASYDDIDDIFSSVGL